MKPFEVTLRIHAHDVEDGCEWALKMKARLPEFLRANIDAMRVDPVEAPPEPEPKPAPVPRRFTAQVFLYCTPKVMALDEEQAERLITAIVENAIVGAEAAFPSSLEGLGINEVCGVEAEEDE